MTERDRATGAHGNTGVAEMDRVKGSIYLGDPGVDILHRILLLVSYLILYHLIIYKLHTASFAPFDLTRPFRGSVWSHSIAGILTAG